MESDNLELLKPGGQAVVVNYWGSRNSYKLVKVLRLTKTQIEVAIGTSHIEKFKLKNGVAARKFSRNEFLRTYSDEIKEAIRYREVQDRYEKAREDFKNKGAYKLTEAKMIQFIDFVEGIE